MSTLLAAGGALDLHDPATNDILSTFVARAGGHQARLVIVTVASAVPHETAAEYTAVFQTLGATHITPFDLSHRAPAQSADQHLLDLFDEATGIYLSGGNQLRLSTLIKDTAVDASLQAAYQRGAIIFGSSAGTAVLSNLMLAYGENGYPPRQGMAHFASGLGLLDGVLFDQHFSQRGRLGRLLTAVANNPHLLGVGIDENTAVLIEDNHATVLGQHAVTLIHGRDGHSNAADCEPGGLISLTNFTLHHLIAGDRFDLATRCAHLPTTRRTFA